MSRFCIMIFEWIFLSLFRYIKKILHLLFHRCMLFIIDTSYVKLFLNLRYLKTNIEFVVTSGDDNYAYCINCTNYLEIHKVISKKVGLHFLNDSTVKFPYTLVTEAIILFCFTISF